MEPDDARARVARIEHLMLDLVHRWRQDARAEGMSWPQRFLLRHLHCQGPTHPHVLARGLGVTPATLTGVLDVLEAKGYVGRLPNREDRRTLWVTIKAPGRAALRRYEDRNQRRLLTALAALEPVEADALMRFLEKLVETWDQEDEPRGTDAEGGASGDAPGRGTERRRAAGCGPGRIGSGHHRGAAVDAPLRVVHGRGRRQLRGPGG